MDCTHFFHCWADGNWRIPAEAHIRALTSSGFDGPITVGLVGTPAHRAEARDRFDRAFTDVRFVEADHGHEEHTLRLVYEYVNQGNPGAVLYAHTHGAWHARDPRDVARLTRGSVEGWERCLGLLADPAVDLVGYLPRMHTRRHADGQLKTGFGVKGNFWAATCDYLRTLEPPPSLPPTQTWRRGRNERWVLSGWDDAPRAVWPEKATQADLRGGAAWEAEEHRAGERRPC
jgi:hypothetical protein